MNSRISAISLQTKLASGILLISFVLVGFAMMLLNQARGDFARMERIESIHHCGDHLILAIENLAFERGRTNVVLAADSPIDAANLAFIQSRRQHADKELEASLELLAVIEPQLVRPLQIEYDKHRYLRQQVDAEFGVEPGGAPVESLPEHRFGLVQPAGHPDVLGALTREQENHSLGT